MSPPLYRKIGRNTRLLFHSFPYYSREKRRQEGSEEIMREKYPCRFSWRQEFQKAAIIQSHDCAKHYRICANFGLFNAKQEQLALISCICKLRFILPCKSDSQSIFLKKQGIY